MPGAPSGGGPFGPSGGQYFGGPRGASLDLAQLQAAAVPQGPFGVHNPAAWQGAGVHSPQSFGQPGGQTVNDILPAAMRPEAMAAGQAASDAAGWGGRASFAGGPMPPSRPPDKKSKKDDFTWPTNQTPDRVGSWVPQSVRPPPLGAPPPPEPEPWTPPFEINA